MRLDVLSKSLAKVDSSRSSSDNGSLALKSSSESELKLDAQLLVSELDCDDDDDDVEEMLTFPLKYSDCRFLELYIEKKDVPSFGYHTRLLTQADNNVGPSSPFVTPMMQTDSVKAIFAEQHSTTVGPSCPIIQSPMVTSPVSSAMVSSPLLEVVVSAGDDPYIGNDDWIVGGINSDNLDFESDKSEDEDCWMDEDSNSNDDDGEDENDYEDVQTNINVEEFQSRLHEPP